MTYEILLVGSLKLVSIPNMGLELYLPISAILGFFLFLVINDVWRAKTKNANTKMPPGPSKLPLIGNIHQLIGAMPHHSLAKLAKQYGPLMK